MNKKLTKEEITKMFEDIVEEVEGGDPNYIYYPREKFKEVMDKIKESNHE